MRIKTKQALVPCAAIAFTIGMSMISLAAAGWQEEGGVWRYYNSGGDMATECWKKSGNHWFWLDSDGEMLTDSLVEDGDDYYYVNEAGAMVKNEWRELDNTDDGEGAADTCWYYLGASGKAYKAPGSGKTAFKTIGGSKYAFDEEARMLYGWVDEESGRVDDEDAWKTGMYYLGAANDGRQRSNRWEKLETDDEDNSQEDFDGYHWFWFGSNGKKVQNIDPEGYDDGEERWYYAQNSGELVKSQIKKINGRYYGFDEYGKMLLGLYKMSVNDREIQSYVKIENENDLLEEADAWQVYYFGNSPKEGAMAAGTVKIEVDGEDYTYEFRKSGGTQGEGYDGIENGSIYIKGRLLKVDREARLEKVSYGGEEYLINYSGKIQKNKKNARNADGRYYCTNSEGVVTYEGSEKWVKED